MLEFILLLPFADLLEPEASLSSATLNHAKIIGRIRLCKAQYLRYTNNDMADLETKFKEVVTACFRWIAAAGALFVNGFIASLQVVFDPAEQYNTVVDGSYRKAFEGLLGRGTHRQCSAMREVDIHAEMKNMANYFIWLSYHVVTRSQANLCAQIFAAHSQSELEPASETYKYVKDRLAP